MRRVTFLIVLCIAISCNSTKQADVIPVETMQKILIDLHYAEIYSAMLYDSSHQIRNKNMDSLAVFYKSIQEHYSISDEQLITSIDWYKHNPEQLDTTYAKMITTVSEVETVLGKK